MSKMKLTQSKINGLKLISNTKMEICDTDQIGFYVEVRANSSTYYQRFRDHNGTQRSYKIALTHELSLKEAKKQGLIIKSKHLTGVLELEEEQRKEQQAAITLNDYYTTVYLVQTATSKRAKTKVSQASVYNTNVKDSIGNIALNKLTKKDLIQVQDTMQARGVKSGSINKVTSLVRHIVQHAIDREYIAQSTIISVKLKPADAGKERYLSHEEVIRLLDVLAKWETRSVALLLTFTLATGARVGEVMKADWSHIDLVKKVWEIPPENDKINKGRTVPLNETAMMALAEAQTIAMPNQQEVFRSTAGKKKGRYTTVTLSWYKIREAANIADVRIHDLRHSFASFLINEHVPIAEISKLLGHTNVKTTQRYAHLDQTTITQATAKLDKVLRAA